MQTREVSWDEVSQDVAKANPAFYEVMESIAQKKTLKLYLASYKFGELVVKNGISQLPIDNQLISINDPSLPDPFKQDLNYAHMSVGIFLNTSAEIFLPFDNRVYPVFMFDVGNVNGLWEMLDLTGSVYHQRAWHIAAGARSLFMVPKIMDHTSHSRLQRMLALDETYPAHNVFSQGNYFKQIIQSNYFNSDWRCQVLYLSRAWFETLPKAQWERLHYTALKTEWANSAHLRNLTSFEITWHLLTHVQTERRVKQNAYIIDTVKHLLNMINGSSLGFRPLTATDQHILPLSIIEQAYLELYQLKHYIPTLLAPTYLDKNSGDPIYYSFLQPTLLSLSPNHNFRNTLEDERNVKQLIEHFQFSLQKHKDALYHFTDNIEYQFFHFEPDSLYHIKSSSTLPEFDARFIDYPLDQERSFCENGPFVRACASIRAKTPRP